ncbi:uncharacterized protein B0T15DRAFT_83518 [Chaetomium strumarium]|uniref:Uncharacterized protein n=1 Tax=Chaetomium strumarium TaxID=1170767 RepID=A0AAJ0M7B3_9PEZI|nr:hypothetical protein B0T15DRAFT_83518 [Chaetomium strumarium]
MADQLRALITPALLNLVVDTVIPFSPTEPLDFAIIAGNLLGAGPPLASDVVQAVWPILVSLSKLGLGNIPDLTTFLPPSSDPQFPRQALGLQLLVDQMPRRLCKGIDARWTNAYFDVISLRYAQTLDALPVEVAEKPASWGRWKALGTTLGYWVLVRTWFVAPFVHTDQVAIQERALALTEETRRQVEEVTRTTDPYRAQREAILSDVYGFPRVFAAGPPKEVATVQDYTYWMCMLMDVHKPIVDRFGRYPYRNAYFGRDDTPEEEEWFERTGGFARPSPEVRERLRRDIDAGVWLPLGAEKSGR